MNNTTANAEFSIHIRLALSRVLYLMMYGLYAVLIIALVLSNMALSWLYFAVSICLLSFCWIQYRQDNIRYIAFQENTGWKIGHGHTNLQYCEVTLLPGSYCSRYLLILHFKAVKQHKKYVLLILPDTIMSLEALKLLRNCFLIL